MPIPKPGFDNRDHPEEECLRVSLGQAEADVEALVQELLSIEQAKAFRRDKAAMEASLSLFMRQAWSAIMPSVHLVWEPHMDAICLHVEAVRRKEIRNVVINVPPGTTKSLITNVFWPAWQWTTEPEKWFLYAANEENLVVRDSLICRQLITSDWYKAYWGTSFNMSKDQNLKMRYENSRHGVRECVTVGSNVTGKKGDYLVMDDLHDTKKAMSDVERTKVKNWVRGAFSNRFRDFRTGCRVAIGQRVHIDDLYDMLIGMGWENLCLPEEYDPDRHCRTSIGFEDWRKKRGELLRPQRFGPKEIKEARALHLDFGYETQHQQNPKVTGGSLFKDEWFFDKVVSITAIPERCSFTRYWDKAGTEGGGAYTCGALMARSKDGRFFVVDVIRVQLNVYDREQLIVKTAHADTKTWGTTHVVVEQEPGSAGKESAQATIGRLQGFIAHKDRVTGSKLDRARPFASQCGAGNVYLVRDVWNAAWLAEICTFPEGKYADQTDATSGAFAYIGKTLAPGTWKLERW